MSFLKVKNVNKKLKGKTILSDISFSGDRGQVIGLVGPNGAGKSTLLKIIANLIKPDEGEIHLENGSLGYLIEEPPLYPYLTAREHLEICLKLQDKPVNPDLVEATAESLGITSFLDKKTKKYSMGMKQRVGIASALIHDPDIIILDEPTNSLDIKGIDQIKRVILQQKEKGKLVIVSSHLLKEIQAISDHFILLEQGKVIRNMELDSPNNNVYKIQVEKTAKSLKTLSAVSIEEAEGFITLETDNKSLQNVLRLLLENNLEIQDIEKKNTALERYFINVN
ncbi:ABC transporter ATP-binding protein [Bacillus marinisedimentorum]|uniref:ABC transporter ATP-binding protein n=1 Tax=Bacillus marinisedimentorum TaxID=1821260 RepID=UPI0008727941|nr:ABC transporter ATP-binding protein [Bacillus marinisedimentorum]